MTTTLSRLTAEIRPQADADYREVSRPRTTGLASAGVGILVVVVALVGNIAVGTGNAEPARTLPWTFGLTTTGFALIQLGIAVVLWGILMKLWLRIDSIKIALARLIPAERDTSPAGARTVDTEYGLIEIASKAPGEKKVHTMAKRLWLPMLVMGVMGVAAGTVLAFVWANAPSVTIAAWSQGVEFLGEMGMLSAISLLLGTILWAIRTGGGEVQESLGVPVKTLAMPAPAKAFIGFMALGMMIEIAQFVLYLVVASGVRNPAAWFAALGPVREFGLGMFLTGITLALVAIATALRFQFGRAVELIRTGR